jgi:hypothetical protein
VRLEVGPESLDVCRPLVRLAQRVDDELHLRQAETGEELPRERDHLGVEECVVAAEHLHADLVELAVPAGLGLLVAEVGPGVPDLPRRDRAVLGEGPAHTGGLLGPQRDVAVALVDEVVHLLRDDVGGVPEPEEDPEVLEHRRDDALVPGGLDGVGEDVRERAPAPGLGRQDVAGTRAGLETRHDSEG